MNLKILDHFSKIIGEISNVSENGIVLGDFIPSAEFSKYASLFKNFERAVNAQLFVEVDRLEREIAELDFCVLNLEKNLRRKISDLQIMEAGIGFHW